MTVRWVSGGGGGGGGGGGTPTEGQSQHFAVQLCNGKLLELQLLYTLVLNIWDSVSFQINTQN